MVTIAIKKGCIVNHKRVLRNMKENKLVCSKFHKIGRRYSFFKVKVGKTANNILNRKFAIKETNEVWISDVTKFKIPGSQLKLYLSPIMNLFNS